jgi:hypothetical protein
MGLDPVARGSAAASGISTLWTAIAIRRAFASPEDFFGVESVHPDAALDCKGMYAFARGPR